jgi:hypothetical protein
MECVFCHVEMVKIEGALPDWIRPDKIIDLIKEARPGLWGMTKRFYTGEAAEKALKQLAEKVSTFKCPKCGWIAIFEHVAGATK